MGGWEGLEWRFGGSCGVRNKTEHCSGSFLTRSTSSVFAAFKS